MDLRWSEKFCWCERRHVRKISAEILGAQVLKEIKNRFALKDNEIDYIIGGNAVAGGGNITRLAALTAGLSEEIPAVTLDLQCGSSLEALQTAAAKIESGLADLVIAGGFESSSTQPFRMWNPNHRTIRKENAIQWQNSFLIFRESR